MVVAIDGPAGVGKSTLAKYLSQKWGLHYLNTGKHYRAVTYLARERGLLIDPPHPLLGTAEAPPLVALAYGMDWKFDPTDVVIGERKLGQELHAAEIDRWVALVSEIPSLREVLNHWFRYVSKEHALVCEGRDVTSAVFPQAEVRIFLDASPEVRAQRRYSERSEGMTFEAILESIKERDRIDRSKPVGALVLTPGCILLDSSRLTIQDVCEKVDTIVREHRQ